MYWRTIPSITWGSTWDSKDDVRFFSVGFNFQMMDMWAEGKAGDIIDANGLPLLSWRVANLPYMERVTDFQRFRKNEPWNSENNLALLPTMEPGFGNESPKSDVMLIRSKMGFTDTRGQKKFNVALILVDPTFAVEWTKPGTPEPTVDTILSSTKSFAKVKMYPLGGANLGFVLHIGRDIPTRYWDRLLKEGPTLEVINLFKSHKSVESIDCRPVHMRTETRN